MDINSNKDGPHLTLTLYHTTTAGDCPHQAQEKAYSIIEYAFSLPLKRDTENFFDLIHKLLYLTNLNTRQCSLIRLIIEALLGKVYKLIFVCIGFPCDSSIQMHFYKKLTTY